MKRKDADMGSEWKGRERGKGKERKIGLEKKHRTGKFSSHFLSICGNNRRRKKRINE